MRVQKVDRNKSGVTPPVNPSCPSLTCWGATVCAVSEQFQMSEDRNTYFGVDERNDTALGDDDMAKQFV